MIATVLSSLLLGGIAWTLLEYILHRWLGHDARTRPNPFAAEDIRHDSQGHYFAPAWKKALTAVLFVAVLSLPAVNLTGVLAGSAFAVGLVAMYVAYEVLHRRDHTHPGMGSYMRFLRRHHFYHHFTDPNFNHGVTTPIWDWVFGTLRAPGLIRVPPKLAMKWLVDPRTGSVHASYAKHYELKTQSA